jgi:arginyl-tRNA synthetase
VLRVNYQGDVGAHVAKAVWGLQDLLQGRSLEEIPAQERSAFLSKAYAHGSRAFEADESAKAAIGEINKKIYQSDPSITDVYNTGRQWSLDYFEEIYTRLQTRFDHYYFESEVGPVGVELIEKHRDIFEESDGAIVYRGEQDGLHTRVFLNSQGFPVYETKELGLAATKEKDYAPDISITFTGNEIVEYFKVVKAVLARIEPEWSEKIVHIAHGMVRLPEGKMSSRTGDVITATWLLDTVEERIRAESPDSPSILENTLGAIKYGFLHHRIGGNIAFSINESISLQGNSGPYVQYAHARACRVLEKLETTHQDIEHHATLEADERELARAISMFPETIEAAVQSHSPHVVCTYLYSLAQTFNRFYEHNRVAGDTREAIRAQLVRGTAQTLRNGLFVLNIPAPEKM